MINSNKSKLNKKRNPRQASTELVAPKAKTIKLGVDRRGRSRQTGSNMVLLLFIARHHSGTLFNNCDFILPSLASLFPFTVRRRGRSRQTGSNMVLLLFIARHHSGTLFNNCDFILPSLASLFPFTVRTALVTPDSSPIQSRRLIHPRPTVVRFRSHHASTCFSAMFLGPCANSSSFTPSNRIPRASNRAASASPCSL